MGALVKSAVRRGIFKKAHRVVALEKAKNRAIKNRQTLNEYLPFDFVQREKRELDAQKSSLDSQITSQREALEKLSKRTGITNFEYSKSRKKGQREEPEKSPHQKAVEKVLKGEAFWSKPRFKGRFLQFAKQVERKGVNVKIKEKHLEGDFDVGLYFGDTLQGWFGVAFDKKLNCLVIDSIQGKKFVSNAAFREKIASAWYAVLANRIVSALHANGEKRIALVTAEHQDSAKHNPASAGLYATVARILKKKSKKMITTKDGKYEVYFIP